MAQNEFTPHLNFFLFTLLGSVLMLAAIIAIYWLTGTTDITQIYEIKIPKEYQNLLWLAFFSSFAVKTPMWPVHTWLPDAHVEAPTAGSVILAAILLKMAGYGFLRSSIPMFPLASEFFYTFGLFFKYNSNNLHFLSSSYARRYEKINCILLSSPHGICNIGYFYFNQTRY